MADPQALRQALMARKMQLAPEEPEGIDPALLESLSQNPPIPDMGGPQGGAPEDMFAQDMGGQVPPEVQLEMERARVKDMLKRTRMKELDAETDLIRQNRMAEIEGEASELFAPKKKSGGY